MTVDVKEAVSCLIFAASRCGELPELIKLRSLFQNWYSNEFDDNNVNFRPTNFVKLELKSVLSSGSISNEVKLELVKEIIKDYADCRSMNCQQVCDVDDKKHYFKDNQALNKGKSSPEKPKHTESMQSLPDRMILDSLNLDQLSESGRDSALQTLYLNDKDIYVIHEEQYEGYQEQGLKYEKGLSKFPKKPNPGYISKKASNESHEINYIDDASSRKLLESTPQIQEKDIVYLDDMKEKTLPRSYYDYEATNLSPNSNGVGKRTLLCCDTNAYQPLPQEPSKKESNKHNLKKSAGDDNKTRVRTEASGNLRQSYDGRMKQDMQQSKKRTLNGFFENEGGDRNNFLLGHVHPKLPHYEELEAKFKHPEAGVGNGSKTN
ncbi:uncharacterized protein LOC110720198 [Chenopodium quinoa]|uniref:uncharacterized protein LOC110720198 n=1 Tax=Chenopodium quinoa TaxID=63459 RepID=UPI000B7935E9|nr:uncharacterized protein LOC110720198 [Chenopodium quinoa]